MTTNEMNMEKVIKEAERMINRTISKIDFIEEDGLTATEYSLTIAVATAIIKEASSANPSMMKITNMKLALDNLIELSNTDDKNWSVKAYCCSILYLSGETRYDEHSIRKFALKKHTDEKLMKKFNTKIGITLNAMNLK